MLCFVDGMMGHLYRAGVLLENFGEHAQAQTIMDRMHKINWPRMLDAVARRLNPAHRRMFRGLGMAYYWSAFQTEWATDTTFTSSDVLAKIYPQLVRGAIRSPVC